jgi:hypothetical protein
MYQQAAILSDVIRIERARATSPARLAQRRLASELEALRCCTGASLASRLRASFERSPAACCATA